MSFMNKIFGSNPAPVAPTAATPGNMPATQAAPAATPGNPLLPNPAATAPVDPNRVESPLDAFTDLFKIDPAAIQEQKPFFNVDPQKLRDAASKNDFSKVISPEMLQTLQAGGPEAVNAMVNAMNMIAQKGYGDSALATTQIVESALKRQQEAFEAKLPGFIKNHSVAESLRNENPIFNHPAAQPLLDVLKQAVNQKFPNATVKEQTETAQNYLLSLVQQAQPAAKSDPNALAKGETDWDKYASI